MRPARRAGIRPAAIATAVNRVRAPAEDVGQGRGPLPVVPIDRVGVHPGTHVASGVEVALLVEHHQAVRVLDRIWRLRFQDFFDELERTGIVGLAQPEQGLLAHCRVSVRARDPD